MSGGMSISEMVGSPSFRVTVGTRFIASVARQYWFWADAISRLSEDNLRQRFEGKALVDMLIFKHNVHKDPHQILIACRRGHNAVQHQWIEVDETQAVAEHEQILIALAQHLVIGFELFL